MGPDSVEKMLADFTGGGRVLLAVVDSEAGHAGPPVRDVAELTHEQVIEVLVADQLTSPAPLVHVQNRAERWAAGEAFGSSPACSTTTGSAACRTPSPRSWTT